MSVGQNTGVRKAFRQLLVAAVACTAVVAGATFAVSPDTAPASSRTTAGVTEDNGWPVIPPKPTPTN